MEVGHAIRLRVPVLAGNTYSVILLFISSLKTKADFKSAFVYCHARKKLLIHCIILQHQQEH